MIPSKVAPYGIQRGEKIMNRILTIVLTCLCLIVLMDDCLAANEAPGSLLLFPLFDTKDLFTIFSITNQSDDSITVRLVWIEGTMCFPYDNWIELTPKDTYTFLANALIPWQLNGFLYAYVVDGLYSDKEVKADVLIGQELVIGFWDDKPVDYSLNAVSFQAMQVNGDGKLNLDGSEYNLAPKTVYFPRFLGQGDFTSRLIFINLTGGRHFDVTTSMLIYNDNEYGFSATETFDCHEVVGLSDISGVFDNTYLLASNHDPSEPVGFSSLVETGFFEITGVTAYSNTHQINDPSIFAVLIEAAQVYTAADLPFYVVDPDYSNGMLWSVNPSGS